MRNKILGDSYCRHWLFRIHDNRTQRWLDRNYHLQDHKDILQWAWRYPKLAYIVVNDFHTTDKKKIVSVLNHFTGGKSKICLLVGKRGGGKTACAFWFAEKVKEFRPVYYSGLPNDYLPKWCHYVKDISAVPDGSFVMVDESAIFHSSRDFKKDPSQFLTKKLTVLRHRDVTILYICPNSALEDKSLERLADIMIFKPLSLFQFDTERDSVRNVFIDKMRHREITETLFIASNDVGSFDSILFNQPLPDCWNNNLSTPFSSIKTKEAADKFIKKCRLNNFTDDEIKLYLKLKGWNSVPHL